MKSVSQNIQVAVRIRNLPSWHGRDTNSVKFTAEHNRDITKTDPRSPATGISSKIILADPASAKEDKDFSFDFVFNQSDDQEVVFNTVVKDMVTRCMNGYNGCIFTYGQTASGKTYTMGGPKVDNPKDRGIIARVAELIVNYIDTNSRADRSKGGVDYEITGSYLEIYQEELRDLLRGSNEPAETLKIRLDPKSVTGKDLTVVGLKQVPLVTENDYVKTLEQAIARRVVAETNMNAVSSRSHSVFTLTITQKDRFLDTKGDPQVGIKKRSKLHLIDLAGSERVDSTGATGERLKEGAAINQSLSCLGNVINALSTKASFVPYRDSKLTYLLSDSLGGNSLTLMIACITPIAGAYEESLSTLRFAERAKKVVNNAKVNVDATTLRIMTLEAENAELKDLLSKCVCQKDRKASIASRKSMSTAKAKLHAMMAFKSAKVGPLDEEADSPTSPGITSPIGGDLPTATSALPPIDASPKTQSYPLLPPIEPPKEEQNYDYENYLDNYRDEYADEIPKYTNKYVKFGFCQIVAFFFIMFVCLAFGAAGGYSIAYYGFYVPKVFQCDNSLGNNAGPNYGNRTDVTTSSMVGASPTPTVGPPPAQCTATITSTITRTTCPASLTQELPPVPTTPPSPPPTQPPITTPPVPRTLPAECTVSTCIPSNAATCILPIGTSLNCV